ncbi:cytochrome P450 monooxygenase [Desarmillaria tabescens]|uniref:Cytochrome P450 monooxygenase n=1 Tax=Armillaria tabescens TaxID=1929756 RepID=A0AA39J5U6_ARMTA|nr:cytochrome P450 monooxygenase [Desarmillaria tabescens]KAK0434863.1 cytochrome P450 monooxygenase [Desarmillaria tabescens]
MLSLILESLYTNLTLIVSSGLTIALLVHLVPYLVDSHGLRSYPGPLVAKFSDAWLGCVSYKGHRSEIIHDLHMRYGSFVRIAPNHISVARADALSVVYGHGNGALKSSFYDAFVSITRGLFNIRDRVNHTRKRKIVSHVFSQKSVLEFEPHVHRYLRQLLGQWDRLYDNALKGMSGDEGEGWTGHDGRLWLDCLPWANYLAFDIIGDLAFGAPFGMIRAARDLALVPEDPLAVMASYGQAGAKYAMKEVPAVKILNARGEYTMPMGAFPGWWRPLLKRTPLFRKGGQDSDTLAGMAIAAVAKRLSEPTDKNDLLSKLQAGKDEQGNPMGREELTAEALTLLIAGSDTTSNSSSAIIYFLARTPRVQEKLHQELDENLDSGVATADQVKNLSYLHACINEGLRLHSTSALGLPRVVPNSGMMILGKYFPPGTVVSVPSYTIHRDPTVWGDDVEEYRPERWFECDSAAILKTFNPFSVGPRACVGRNLATLELHIIIASILKRFHFVLEKPEKPLQVREGFLRKPLGVRVGMKRRDTF